jgi:tetratricopeptide (TPR) repeat protein
MNRVLTIILLFLTAFNVSAAPDSTNNIASVNVSDAIVNKHALKMPGTVDKQLTYAAKLYSTGKYAQAAEIYENIIKNNGDSFEVLYNLGNSYYKSDELAPAILNYERALKIKPGDRDARFNLELCENKIVDKIDPVGVFLVTRLYEDLGDNFSSNNWAFISIAFFIILIASLFAYFFSSFSWLKKVSFYAGLISLIFTILALTYSARKYYEINNPDQAILFSSTSTVKSSPDQSGTDLFILHEGTKVKIKSELGSWKEIEVQDGNVGWIESSHLVII